MAKKKRTGGVGPGGWGIRKDWCYLMAGEGRKLEKDFKQNPLTIGQARAA